MKAGIAKGSITPPVGVDLTGYIGRPGPSARVHDELYATALVLDDGATKAAIVSLDILGIDFDQDAALRKDISETTGIRPQNILIASSHTHAGPAAQTLRGCGSPDENYLRWACSRIVSTVQDASCNLCNAGLFVTGAESGLGINRRDWVIEKGAQASETSGRITDPEVKALLVRQDGGQTVLVLNYACHGVVMGGDNMDISADWIGAARDVLEESPWVDTAMFLQGCCGDINPRCRGTFEEVRCAGESIARPLLAALPRAVPLTDPRLRVAWKSVDLPLTDLPPEEELEQEISFRHGEVERMRAEGASRVMLEVDRAMLSWAKDCLKAHEAGGGPSEITVGLQAIAIGPVVVAGIPGEAFCEIGLRIKEMSSADIFVAGYANGNIGYIPTAAAYREGGYETCDAFKYYGTRMIGPQSAGIIIDAMKNLLAQVEH